LHVATRHHRDCRVRKRRCGDSYAARSARRRSLEHEADAAAPQCAQVGTFQPLSLMVSPHSAILPLVGLMTARGHTAI
jgi:hypothetical protein